MLKSSLPMGDMKPLPRYYYLAKVRQTDVFNKSYYDYWVSEFSSVKAIEDHFNKPFYKNVITWRKNKYTINLLGYKKLDSKEYPRHERFVLKDYIKIKEGKNEKTNINRS